MLRRGQPFSSKFVTHRAVAVRGRSMQQGIPYHAHMASYLHTMYRITDPARSRAFYEALGMEVRREMDIVRNGECEATNYFLGFPGHREELELTFNHDGRTYDLGSGYGHIAIGVEDMHATLAQLKSEGIEPERNPYRVRDGGSLLCFVRDPDGYRVELIERNAEHVRAMHPSSPTSGLAPSAGGQGPDPV